jgi:dolichyl-phosphooligosaccharide-protein glycotransferase
MKWLWPATLLAGAMAVALWIWSLPLSLPVAGDLADYVVRHQIESRVARFAHTPADVQWQVDEWIKIHPSEFEAQKSRLAATYRDRLSYTGEDGVQRPYLGNVDSYAWLREARNYLHTGTTCDAVVDGQCRDNYVYGQVGGRMLYNRSLHIAAIVELSRLIRLFRPRYPLPAASALIPIIVGALAAVPAFFIGRRLAGDLGGLTAAVLITTNGAFLGRGFGSDNDVWNVTLPLFMVWSTIAAIDAKDARRRVAYAVVAAGFTCLHAITWSGWVLGYGVIMIALAGTLTLRIAARVVAGIALEPSSPRDARGREGTGWQRAPEVRAAATVVLVYFLATGLFTTIAGAEPAYFKIAREVVGRREAVIIASHGVEANDATWPDMLTTVSELQKTTFHAIAHTVGGKPYFFGAVVGLLLLLLPRGRRTRSDVAVLLAAAVCPLILVAAGTPGRATALALLAAPLGVLLLRALLRPAESAGGDRAGALVVTVWFLAGVYVAFGGMRLLFLLTPAFGLAFGALVGRLYERAAGRLESVRPRYAMPAKISLFVLGVATLIHPVQSGYVGARAYTPDMRGVWWNTLTKIREQSAPDAIVDTFWDYGYWVKYGAERRVNADGSSLQTHMPYWFARAMVSASEREAVGLLRMLNCGADVLPHAEGRRGAYAKILAKVHDPVTAQSMVVDLADRDRAAAATYLADHGFSPAEQAQVLAASHCVPPESYVILSATDARKDAWVRLGLWDFRKAEIARLAASEPAARVTDEIVRRFGYSPQEAATLVARARTLPRQTFAMPEVAPTSRYWAPCRPAPDGRTLHCTMAMVNKATQQMVLEFVYDPAFPHNSRLHFFRSRGGSVPGTPAEGSPAAILLAGAEGIQDLNFSAPTYPDYAVLVDVLKRRILIGSPPFIRSTFTQLLFLDGRYARRFKKFDDEISDLGHVVTWKVRWNDSEPGDSDTRGAPPHQPSRTRPIQQLRHTARIHSAGRAFLGGAVYDPQRFTKARSCDWSPIISKLLSGTSRVDAAGLVTRLAGSWIAITLRPVCAAMPTSARVRPTSDAGTDSSCSSTPSPKITSSCPRSAAKIVSTPREVWLRAMSAPARWIAAMLRSWVTRLTMRAFGAS